MSTPIAAAAPRFICRCEEVLYDEIVKAIAEGGRTINDLKRRTRAGMGVCQGVYCVPAMAELLHRETSMPRESIAPMTARPPVRVVSLASLADLEE